MEINNYTPLDSKKFNLSSVKKDSEKKINTVLLVIATISAAVLAVLLLILIQKKRSSKKIVVPKKINIISPSITNKSNQPTSILPTSVVSPVTEIPSDKAKKKASPSATGL